MTQNPEGRPKPSKRPRYRYIAFQVHADERPDRERMIRAIQQTADRHDLRPIEPWLTRFNGEYGILRCLRGGEQAARRLLDAIHEVDGTAVRVEPLSTSGTIASLQRKVLRDVRLDP